MIIGCEDIEDIGGGDLPKIPRSGSVLAKVNGLIF
jgi:hypothetical protein